MFGIPAGPVRTQAVYDDSEPTTVDRMVPALLCQLCAVTLHGRHDYGPQRRIHGGAGTLLHRRDHGTATTWRSVVNRWGLPQHRHHARVLHRRTHQLADHGAPQRARTYTHLPHAFPGNKTMRLI